MPFALAETCAYCGEPTEVELLEVWNLRDFQIATCCEAVHEEIVDTLNDPDERRELLRWLGAEELLGGTLRDVSDVDCGRLVLNWKLDVREITLAEAKAFIGEHHEHNAPPVGWRFGAGLWNGADLVAVVTVGNPVARAYNGRGIVEVNRLCVRRDVDSELTRHACSQLYAWAAREAKRRGFVRIITYTLDSEPGTSLRAAGWQFEANSRGGSWNRPSRTRATSGPVCAKRRWGKTLRRAA